MPPLYPPTPALLQSTCTAPNASKARSASASTLCGFETSVSTASSSAPVSRSEAAVASRASRSTSARTTRMPSSAKRCASPRPIPLAAPVTTATRPSNCCIARPSAGARCYELPDASTGGERRMNSVK